MSPEKNIKQIVVTYDSHKVGAQTLSKFAVHGTTVFDSFDVLGLDCDEKNIEAIRSINGIINVHVPRFRLYTKILWYLDQLCQLPAEKRAEILVVNLSSSPGPYHFNEAEPMNVATRATAEKGFVIVVAVGNEGPAENTLNPWSVAPWVIGVGAADCEGKELWEHSSVGSPGDPLYHPTVVAPGKDVPVLIASDAYRMKRHGTAVASVALSIIEEQGEALQSGTSLATPLVSRICWYIINFFDVLNSIDCLLKKVSQSGKLDLQDAMRLSRIEPLSEFLSELKAHGIGYKLKFSPFMVRQIIEAMARPMECYATHQIGAGFVDDHVAESYLTRFSPRDFLQFFGEGRVDSSFIDQLDKSIGSLVPREYVVTEIIGYVRKQVGVADFSITNKHCSNIDATFVVRNRRRGQV